MITTIILLILALPILYFVGVVLFTLAVMIISGVVLGFTLILHGVDLVLQEIKRRPLFYYFFYTLSKAH